MAKVEIDTPGVTIRIDDEPGGPELDARALALYRAAVGVDAALPTGPANGLQAERRGERALGFGQRPTQAPGPYQHHDGGE